MAVNATEASQVPRIDQLFVFREPQPGEQPPAAAGAAMLALIAQQQFPGWALAFYDALSAAGKGHAPPPRLALIAEDAILLAPQQAPGGWRGFIIAEGLAQGQTRQFQWSDHSDSTCWLAVPRAASGGGAVWAEEAAFLAIQPFPDTPHSP